MKILKKYKGSIATFIMLQAVVVFTAIHISYFVESNQLIKELQSKNLIIISDSILYEKDGKSIELLLLSELSKYMSAESYEKVRLLEDNELVITKDDGSVIEDTYYTFNDQTYVTIDTSNLLINSNLLKPDTDTYFVTGKSTLAVKEDKLKTHIKRRVGDIFYVIAFSILSLILTTLTVRSFVYEKSQNP